MKDIHEVLRRKQAKYAQLAKQIEALLQAAEKLRESAPLLAENEPFFAPLAFVELLLMRMTQSQAFSALWVHNCHGRAWRPNPGAAVHVACTE